MFTLNGHYIKYLIEVQIDDIEDFIVTKDQQIFLLRRVLNRSFDLVQYTSIGNWCQTIDIDGCGFYGGGLCLLKSGHLAIVLKSHDEYDDDDDDDDDGNHKKEPRGTVIQIFG